MEIRFILEDHDEENLVDPSGEVLLKDEKTIIKEPIAYLDAWLIGLITGLKEVQSGRSALVDVEEPHRVLLQLEGRAVRIEYKDAAVCASTVEEFSEALRAGGSDFLRQLDAIGEANQNEGIRSIRAFVQGGLTP